MAEPITEPRLIPLKAKYRSAHKGRYKGGDTSAPKKPKRRKLSDAQKRNLPPQPHVVLHIDSAGNARIIKRSAS